MTKEQFEQLRNIFTVAREEATNDDQLSDWLINMGGSLIAIAVSLMNDEAEAI